MRRALFASAFFVAATFTVPFALGQETPGPDEVGVDERLNASVPLDLTLNDETGQPVTLRSLIDRPTILTLNYFSCAGICTPLLNGMADTMGRIALDPGKDFRVVTVSFDPRDTPEIAARKRDNYLRIMKRPVSPSAWRFLTGPAAATQALADAVGFKFKPSGRDFVHPGVIIVLSPQGRVARYLYGVHFLPADVQMAVGEASRGLARPMIAKFAEICYSYDPEGRRYVFNLTRVVGLITLAAGGLFVAYLLFWGRKRTGARGGQA